MHFTNHTFIVLLFVFHFFRDAEAPIIKVEETDDMEILKRSAQTIDQILGRISTQISKHLNKIEVEDVVNDVNSKIESIVKLQKENRFQESEFWREFLISLMKLREANYQFRVGREERYKVGIFRSRVKLQIGAEDLLQKLGSILFDKGLKDQLKEILQNAEKTSERVRFIIEKFQIYELRWIKLKKPVDESDIAEIKLLIDEAKNVLRKAENFTKGLKKTNLESTISDEVEKKVKKLLRKDVLYKVFSNYISAIDDIEKGTIVIIRLRKYAAEIKLLEEVQKLVETFSWKRGINKEWKELHHKNDHETILKLEVDLLKKFTTIFHQNAKVTANSYLGKAQSLEGALTHWFSDEENMKKLKKLEDCLTKEKSQCPNVHIL